MDVSLQVGVDSSGLSRRELLRMASIGAASLGLVAACGEDEPAASESSAPGQGTDPASGEPTRGGQLVVGRTWAIELLDPTVQPLLGLPGGPYARAVYDVLLPIEHGGDITRALATGYEISADGLQITCELRDGVQWHSGRDLVADDVVWNFMRLKDPAFADDVPRGNVPARAQAISDVRALDDLTVRFELSAPDLAPLTLMQSILKLSDPESADAMEAAEAASGTGPYKLDEFIPGRSLRLVPNTNYWGEVPPYLDEIELRTLGDEQALAVQLEAGEIHVAEALPLPDVARLQAAGYGQAVSNPSGLLVFMANVTSSPLDDRRVRQALMHAIDRERINEQALAGYGKPTAVIWPAGGLAYDEAQANAYPFDLDRSRALLDEAGVSDLEIQVIVRNDGPRYEQMAEILRNDLAQIGVTLQVELVELAVVNGAAENMDYQLIAGALSAGYLDGASVLAPPYLRPNPTENVTGFANERYTELARAASVLGLDDEERANLLHEMTDLMLEEAFVLPVTSAPFASAFAGNVHDVTYSPAPESPELHVERRGWTRDLRAE